MAAYRTDLEDSADTLTSTAAIKEYLSNWAKEKGITCTTDGHDNVIMSVKASEEYKEADPTVIVCSYDPKQFRTCIDPIALSLYAVKNNESTGRLTVSLPVRTDMTSPVSAFLETANTSPTTATYSA